MERVSKERRRLLKQYCCSSLSYYPRVRYSTGPKSEQPDPTGEIAVRKMLIKEASKVCDRELRGLIIIAATRGWSYKTIRERIGVPCSSGKFYRRLEKFYLALDELIRNNYISYNEP